MPRSIKIIGIAPPELASSPLPVRRQFWSLVAPIALAVKDKELAAGLDAHGDPLKPIRERTRKNRRSAMTPSGKGSPEAPPLMPAYQKSRTRSLLAARVLPTHVELYWRFDPFTGDQWSEILTYQRKMGRDVFGVSPKGMKEIQVKSWAAWQKWKKSGLAPTEGPLPALPSAALTAGPQSRIAQIIAGSALPNAGAKGVPQIGSMSTKYITRGIQAPTVQELRKGGRTGGLTGADWRRYYTAETGGGGGGVVTKPPKPQPIKPRIVAAMKPAKPKLTPLDRIRRGVEQARTEQAKAHQIQGSPIPHLIDPKLPIGDRIKAYTLGDAKIKAMTDYHAIVAKEAEKTIARLKKEIDALQVQASKQNKAWHKLVAQFEKADQRKNQALMEQLAPKVDEAFGTLTDTRKRYDAIDEQIKELRRTVSRRSLEAIRLDKSESFVFHGVSCEPGAQSKEGPLHPVDSAEDRQTVDQAMEWLGRLALKGSNGPWTDLIQCKIGVGKGYRAHHKWAIAETELYHIQIMEGETVSTVIHEYGHAIDARIITGQQRIGERSAEFLNHRVGTEPKQKLKDLFPDSSYDDHEYGRGDDFDKAHLGDKRKAFYAGKDYGDRDSSEILSMGLELLYKDPVGFSQTDPEWFKYCLGVLDGSLR